MELFEFRKRRLSFIKPLIYWRKQQVEITSFISQRGEGDVDRNKSSTKDQSNSSRDSNLSDSNTGGTGPRASSSTDLSTAPASSSAPLNANSTNSSSKGNNKVERRESARLASGASKFLRSLRSHSKESKDQINVIALKELDSDHSLSPEGKGQQGYSTSRGTKLPERSQSFQEKRLLVVTSKSTSESATGGPPNGHVKVKHSRAQSFVCNSQPSHGFLKHHLQQQQNYQNLQNQQQLRQQKAQQTQNIYSTPQNINGLPPPPPGPTTQQRTLIKPCETIYENLEVILEQNNLNKNSRIIGAATYEEVKQTQSEGVIKNKTESESEENNSSNNNNKMTIFEKDRDRRPSRKLTKDSGYETNYSDYMNIDKLTSSTDSVDSPTITKEFVRAQQQHQESTAYGIVGGGSHGELDLRGGSSSSGVTASKSGDNKEGSLTTSSSSDPPNANLNANTSQHGINSNKENLQNINKTEQMDESGQNENCNNNSGAKLTLTALMDGNRKLRRSISEVPSERMLFSKSQPKKIDSSRTVYSSTGNGLSIWNLEKQTASLSKSGSAQGLYQSPIYGTYQPISSNRGVGATPTPVYPTYSTLPRNHTSGSTTNEGHYQSYYQIGAKSTPSLKHAVSNEQSHVEGASGGLVSNKSSNNPVYQSVPSLSPARSTPNLGSSLGKLQVHSHQQQPAYRDPPVYQPVHSLGRIYRSPNSLNNQQLKQSKSNVGYSVSSRGPTPTKSLSSENVKVLENNKQPNESLYENRKLSVSSSESSSSSEPSQISGNTGGTSLSTSASQNTSQSQNNPQCNSSINSSDNNNSNSTPDSSNMSNGISNGGSWIQNDSNNSNSAPVRDSSNLKQIRYGPGHEKYPSWPIPATSVAEVDPVGEANNTNKLIANSGSARSKSWTDPTDYPKEKVQSYTRPYMKRMNQAYTQQLKTVMEKCENYNSDKSLKGGQRTQQNGYPSSGGGAAILPPPLGYRDLYNQNVNSAYNQQFGPGHQSQQNNNNNCTSPVSSSEKEYNIPSPPERDVKPLTQEDLEMYSKKYEEMMSQYAHSEGYHSYISSECSSYVSSGTPFLDLLRRESGELNQQFWSQDTLDPNDPLFGVGMSHLAASGRESVTTVVTNSSSNSSGTETLKWHGSASDISLASGSVGNCSNSNSIRMWEQQNSQQLQNIAHSAKVPMPQKLHPESVPVHHFESQQQIQNGIRQIKNKLEPHLTSPNTKSSWSVPSSDSSSREINLKKFPLNTYTRPSTLFIEKPQQQQTNSSSSGEKVAKNPPPPPTMNNKDSSSSANSGLPIPPPSPPSTASKPITTSQPSSTSPIIDTSKPPSVAERIWELEQKQSSSSSTSSATSSPKNNQNQSNQSSNTTTNNINIIPTTTTPTNTSSATSTTLSHSEKFVKSSSLNNLREKSQPLSSLNSTTCLSQTTTSQNKNSDGEQTSNNNKPSTPSGSECYKNLWNGYNSDTSSSASTTTGTTTGGVKTSTQTSSNNNSTSVNRVTDSPINNPGSFSPTSYSYLDPEKKHKIADMTLKAIQKKALLSYYERHTGKSTSSSSSISSSDSSCGSSSTTTSSTKNLQSASSSPPKNGSGFSSSGGPDSMILQEQQLTTTTSSSNNNLLEKDSPFPGKSNRLTLSLPRDIDRVKESSIDGGNNFLNRVPSSFVDSDGKTKSNTLNSSSSPSRQSSHNNINSSTIKNKFQPPTPTAKSHETNYKVDNGEIGNQKEELTGESARMAYMSKYLPHLVNRDTTASWNSLKSSTSSSSGGAGSPSTMNNNALHSTMELAPVPPERPPKKPHLRQLSQQSLEDGKETSPPPPLPRAPIRPQSVSTTTLTGPVVANLVTGAPPVPSKPVVAVPVSAGVAVARCQSPELPPPPPPIAEEEVEVINNDEPLPPPPTMTEVSNCLGARSRSVSGLSSYLHKDSYLAQRKERTLGYEGRYRRTLSPSGLGSNNKSGEPVSMGSTTTMTNATSTGKLDTSLTPSAWEKYHNIRPPSTTVIFTSHEIAKSPGVSPTFHRSISCDSNLFNNKTGFTQSTIPPPVAQVAPLSKFRGSSSDAYQYSQIGSHSSLEKVEPFLHPCSSGSSASSSSQSLTCCSSPISGEKYDNSREKSPSLISSSGASDLHYSSSLKGNSSPLIRADAGCQSTLDFVPPTNTNSPSVGVKGPMSSLPSVMVSPLQYERRSNNNEMTSNKECKVPSPLQQNNNNSQQLSNAAVKKSEVSLRVNCTSDVGSQTDMSQQQESQEKKMMKETESRQRTISTETVSLDMSRSSSSSSSTSGSSTTASSCSSSFDDSSSSTKGTHLSIISSYTGRQKTQEELECEELSRHLIKHLPQGDKLQQILVPLPEHKTTADYMEGLFQLELKLKPEKQEKETNTSARSSPDLLQSLPKVEGGNGNQIVVQQQQQPPSPIPNGKTIENSNEDSNKRCNGHAPLPADSAYFTTSECKAKFLTQYVKDMNKNDSAISRSQNSQELNKQKEMLVGRISRKLEILRTEQLEIREEIQSNEQLGQQVVERVKQSAKRNEFDKFKLHVEEIEKITSLLLGLSGRLARAENALMGFAENSNPQEKKILESKRDKLREQLDEAKILKENIDRRSAQVSSFLQKYLTEEDYADYHHFVKMKAKLIIDAREIDEKIKLGEEQMVALKDTLGSS